MSSIIKTSSPRHHLPNFVVIGFKSYDTETSPSPPSSYDRKMSDHQCAESLERALTFNHARVGRKITNKLQPCRPSHDGPIIPRPDTDLYLFIDLQLIIDN